uniref:LHD29B53 n=1 Tax=synthetic construct TaxID=32630 RepID=UPI001E69844B|nr:Chain B, LHD29B53 [synthetic construct]7MWQ_D Chain D, LHD29B53 [synthetic construct]
TWQWVLINISEEARQLIEKAVRAISKKEGTEVHFEKDDGVLHIRVKNLHEKRAREIHKVAKLILEVAAAERIVRERPGSNLAKKALEIILRAAEELAKADVDAALEAAVRAAEKVVREQPGSNLAKKALEIILRAAEELAKLPDPEALKEAVKAAEKVVREQPGSELAKKALEIIERAAEELKKSPDPEAQKEAKKAEQKVREERPGS